ncbi:MAG: YgiQ family radical SAM protein, partial [Spirochaetales bacterium]|nr:YgiQ family radical SAM protein [Spirochaetales bacterium]
MKTLRALRASEKDFLPVSLEDARGRGWDSLDFVCVTGDAYIDHPSFGIAVISRALEAAGFRVGVIARPDFRSAADFRRLGRPRLGFLVTAGNIDSMGSNYTAAQKPRRDDAYAPGGRGGGRPDRASIVYAARAREAYKGVPVILGGLEASLRRLSHYDYWDNKVRRSILLDAKADLLVYGMGEAQILEIAARLAARASGPESGGEELRSFLAGIPGTVYAASSLPAGWEGIALPSFEEVSVSPRVYAQSFALQYANTSPRSQALAESYGEGDFRRFVIQEPPAPPLSQSEFDRVSGLPYARTYHPVYEAEGGVPAIEEVKFSLISSRGCFGSCSFCALTFHQGRIVQARSHESLIQEAQALTKMPDFKGYIHDVGGPTANFRGPACAKQEAGDFCSHRECLFPQPCKNLKTSHRDYSLLLKKLRDLPGVKKVFIRSGLRFDYLMADAASGGGDTFFRELCEHHISGQLKVAPEHISAGVLFLMGKPGHSVYRAFEKKYADINARLGKKQYLVPYFISGPPGSSLTEAVELAEYFRDRRFIPEQVQDFYPTPGTLAACMYHTGIDPRTGQPVFVPKTPREKALQRALMQYKNPKNHALVREALR